MKSILMQNKKLENVLVIISSGIIFTVFLRSLRISSTKTYLDFLMETSIIVSFYLIAYILVAFFFGVKEKTSNIFSLLTISCIGSVVNTTYNLVNVIRNDWWYLSNHQGDLFPRHIEPNIFFLFFDIVVFFIISFILSVCVRIFIKRFETEHNKKFIM